MWVKREFLIRDFATEFGAVLPEARVVYGTCGELNAARDNAVLVPMHFMSDFTESEWLVGEDRALDPRDRFIIATELFGNGRSSSPSNTPAPWDGPRFPVTTIRDNVEAVHRLLAEEFSLDHVGAIVGFSMGAQQAFQWAVSYPSYADRIVATAGAAKSYGHGIVRLEGQIDAITGDPAFMGGEYESQPRAGLAACGLVWGAWLYSQQWWRDELWRTDENPDLTFDDVVQGFRTNFIPDADANDLILHCRTWQAHDVGASPGMAGSVGRALGSITAPFLLMPSASDLYFPIGDAEFEAAHMPTVTLLPIPSLWGHAAGVGLDPTDQVFLTRHIREFLAA